MIRRFVRTRRARSIAMLSIAMLSLTVVSASTDVQTGLNGNEPTTAAVNPLSPSNIAVARGLSVALSTDFGVTFPTIFAAPTNPAVYGTIASWSSCGDASVAFDSQAGCSSAICSAETTAVEIASTFLDSSSRSTRPTAT